MAEVVAISLEVDSGQSVQSVKKLEDAIKDVQKTTNSSNVEEKFNSLNQAIDRGEGSVEDLRKAIKSYQTIALSAGRTSPIGQEALKRSAQLKDKLTDLDNEVKRLAQDGKNLQGAMQIGTGVVAGYQAFTGVTAMLGVENEDLMKTMVKLQASMSVLQAIEQIRLATEKESQAMLLIKNVRTKIAIGLQKAYAFAVGTGSKAMKGFRLALLATGIGALIVGIGLLIANWDKLTSIIFKNSKETKLNNEIQKQALENSADELNDLDKLQKKIQENVNDRNAQTEAVKEFQKTHPDLLQGLDVERASYADINQQIEANITLVKLKAESDALASIRTEKYKEKLQEQLDAQQGANVGLGSAVKAVFTLKGAYSLLTGNVKEFAFQSVKGAQESSKEVIETKQKEIDVLDKIDADIQKKIEKAQSKLFKGETPEEKKARLDKEKREADARRRRSEDKKKEDEKIAKLEEEKQAKLKKLNQEFTDLQNQEIEDENQRAITQLETEQKRELDALIEKYGEKTELEKQLKINQKTEMDALEEEQRLADEEKLRENQAIINGLLKQFDLDSIESTFEKARQELEIQRKADEEKLRLAGATQTQINQLNKDYSNKAKKISEEETEFKKKLKQTEIKQALDASSQVLGSIISLVGEGSAVGKAAAIAQTTIDTYSGAQAAYSSVVGTPFVGPALAPIAAGVAIASGIASIRKIVSTKVPGGGGGGGTGITAPSFNNQTTTQTGNSSNTGTGNGTATGYIPTTKVVLVESELEAMQGRVKQVQQIATI